MKTKFQFQGKDGKWHPLEEGSIQSLKIDMPDITSLNNKYKDFLDAYIEQKCLESAIEKMLNDSFKN